MKTTRERYPELEREIRARHPYSVPEIIGWSIENGSADYLGWVEAECRAG
jgi:periplasmic divalent cation tolerance protein